KKVLPRKWLAIWRAEAERSKGRKLSARERRELKDELQERLLPRVLPTVNLVDALLFHDRRTVLLFATGSSVREAFGKLFFEAFPWPRDRGDPLACARRTGLDKEALAALEGVEPVHWLPRPAAAPAANRTTADAELEA